jgi:lipoate-protein ligase A
MNGTGPCRLLRHAAAPGAWNMAVDEMLLERAQVLAFPCFRFYSWSEATLSLGYFQDYVDRQLHPSSLSCPAVRRLTGGGAILHDAELTYSIILPGIHPLARCRDALYQTVHGCLIETLGLFGITARLAGAPQISPTKEPFLCFQRRSPGDVLLGAWKICGSAQRRRHGAVLQHGSLLWRSSQAAPELPGMADVTPPPMDVVELADRWLAGLQVRLGFTWQADELNEKEITQSQTLVESRYHGKNWTRNRESAARPSQETL